MSARNAHKSSFVRGSLPNIFGDENRKFPQCEQPFYVLAHAAENGMYYNDVELVFQQVVLTGDTVNIIVEKDGVAIPLRGTTVLCPNSPNAVVYLLEWQKYLQNEGVGCYKVSLECVLAGVSVNYVWGNFELQPWNIDTAMHTVRIYTQFNSFALNHNIDFTNSFAVSSIRFRGFFGKMQPNTRVNNLRGNDNIQAKVTRENLKTYTLESDLLNACHTKRIIDLHLLHENIIWICDHNPQNHTYNYRDIELIVSEVGEIDYQKDVRGAVINATFEDKQPYYASKYRTTSPVSNITPTPTCNPVALEINTNPEGSFASGSTVDVQLKDTSGVTVVPESVDVVGQVVTVVVPSSGIPDVYLLDPFIESVGWSVTKIYKDSVFCCRVRRTSDNVEKNILFDGNLIDTVDLLSFIGGSSGALVIWYGQGQLPINITFANPTNQPIIVNGGVLILDNNGLPAFDFQGNKFTINPKIDMLDFSNNYTTVSVASSKDTNNFSPIFSSNQASPRFANYIDTSSNRFSFIFQSAEILLPTSDNTTTPRYQMVNKNNTTVTGYRSTTLTESKTIGAYPNENFTVGMDFNNNFFLKGYLQCLAIIGKSVDASERTYVDTIIMNDFVI